MRFLSQQEHEDLVSTVIDERRIRRRIRELQECRAAGCHTLAEAKIYSEQKRRKEMEIYAQKTKEAGQVINSSKVPQKINRSMGRPESDSSPQSVVDNHKIKGGSILESSGKGSPLTSGLPNLSSFDDWDVNGLPGAELLSETEQVLCCQLRLIPSHYLKIQEVLLQEVLKGSVAKPGDAHSLFKVDPTKVDKIYDTVIKKLAHHHDDSSFNA